MIGAITSLVSLPGRGSDHLLFPTTAMEGTR